MSNKSGTTTPLQNPLNSPQNSVTNIKKVIGSATTKGLNKNKSHQLPNAILTPAQKKASIASIDCTDMDLSDKVIQKSLNILENQFSNKMNPVNKYSLDESFVQIFNLDEQDHWITITKKNGQNEIKIFDSNFKIENCKNENFIAKLKDKLLSLGNIEQLKIVFEPVRQQEDEKMSVLFAIAFAYDLCIGKEPSKQQYIENEMRDHLSKCIKNNRFDEFPKYKRVIFRNTNSRYEIQNIFNYFL